MYNATGQFDKDHLVQHFAPTVKRIAYHLMVRLPPSVQIDDLIQNGMIGLLEAIDRFESGMGAQFETYAIQRVRGAMLDSLRENDWMPRSLRREMRRIEQTISRLEQKHGRAPSENELATALGVSLTEYHRMLQDARGYQVVFFDDMAKDDEDFLDHHFAGDEEDPARILEDESLKKRLVQGIENLPEREKLMMSLYYEQDLNLREIGDVMGITESRVSQLHSQAIARLRARLFGDSEPQKRRGRKHG